MNRIVIHQIFGFCGRKGEKGESRNVEEDYKNKINKNAL